MRDYQAHTVRNGELQVDVSDDFDGRGVADFTFVPTKDAPPLAEGALKSIAEGVVKGRLDLKVESSDAQHLTISQNTLPENLKAGEFGEMMGAVAVAIGKKIFLPPTVRVGGGAGKSLA